MGDADREFMPDDDMNDRVEIDDYKKLPGLGRLTQALALCARAIEPEFRAADARAMAAQRTYFQFAYWAACLGSLATILAIVQLSGLESRWLLYFPLAAREWILPDAEVAMAFAAVAVALAGLGGRKQQKWFLERYQAERLRLLKFHILTRAALWPSGENALSDYEATVASEVTEITTSLYSTLEYWISGGTVPSVLAAPQLTAAELHGFKTYYRARRLSKQTEYFVARMRRNLKQNDRTRILPSVLFFGSVACVLAHYLVKLAVTEPGDVVGRSALLAAAALPALGAVVRAGRGVLEYARNASRCESTHHVLVKLGTRLRDSDDAAALCREIGFCEQVLESDLREWLRLMVESEWFG